MWCGHVSRQLDMYHYRQITHANCTSKTTVRRKQRHNKLKHAHHCLIALRNHATSPLICSLWESMYHFRSDIVPFDIEQHTAPPTGGVYWLGRMLFTCDHACTRTWMNKLVRPCSVLKNSQVIIAWNTTRALSKSSITGAAPLMPEWFPNTQNCDTPTLLYHF